MEPPTQPSPYAIVINDQIFFDPTPRQAESWRITALNRFIWGNRGSGKSHSTRVYAHAKALAHPGLKYIVIRRSFPELSKNHLVYLDDEMKKFGGRYNKSEHICYYENGSIGFYAQCASDQDVRKVVGAEAAIIIFDEAPELDWAWMRLISASVRVPVGSGYGPEVWYLGNPIGPSIDDLFKYFIEKDVDPLEDPEYRPEDWQALRMDLSDNPYLDADQYRKQFAGIPEHIRTAWLDGERVATRQLFRLRKSITVQRPTESGSIEDVRIPYHVIPEMPLFDGKPIIDQPWVQLYRAFDDGWSPDPAYALWLAVAGDQIIAYQEKIWYETTIKDIAVQMQDMTGGRRVLQTFCDPTLDMHTSADILTRKDLFARAGVPMTASVNDRAWYARAVNEALNTEIGEHRPKLVIVESACPYLVKAIPKMRFDEHNPHKMADHKDDHPVVTLAYFLISWGSIASTAPRQPSERPWWMQSLGIRTPGPWRLGTESMRKR
jgi:hypothetical protein